MLKKVLTIALISTIIVLVICCGAALSFIIGCSVIHWLTNNIVFGLIGGLVAVLFVMFTFLAFVEETAERKRLL